MYEILTPNSYDRSEFAGTRSGTWEHVGDEEFDTIEAAREAIVELQQQEFGTLAIRRVGERYPEIGEIYAILAA